jgi:hypothetical protein
VNRIFVTYAQKFFKCILYALFCIKCIFLPNKCLHKHTQYSSYFLLTYFCDQLILSVYEMGFQFITLCSLVTKVTRTMAYSLTVIQEYIRS